MTLKTNTKLQNVKNLLVQKKFLVQKKSSQNLFCPIIFLVKTIFRPQFFLIQTNVLSNHIWYLRQIWYKDTLVPNFFPNQFLSYQIIGHQKKITRSMTGARGYSFELFQSIFNYIEQFSWSILVYLGLSCSISVYLSLFWTILVYFGASWSNLVYLGLSWSISDYLRLSETILDYLGLSWTLLDYLRLSRNTSDYLGLFWTVLDYLGLSGTI